ncbi:MAG: hypothetical protein LKF41_06375 [Bifidobacterium sp.]|nr:hypothetical protein [Bifidobacterium sp.]MCH4175471.1 hypothetical protein [Bifidobacterium sp.]
MSSALVPVQRASQQFGQSGHFLDDGVLHGFGRIMSIGLWKRCVRIGGVVRLASGTP